MSEARDWQSLGVACPRCLETLSVANESQLYCTQCNATYAVHFGIPDLRTGQDPYLSREADFAAASALAARASNTDFRSLLASYYATNDKVPPRQVAMFTHGTVAAGDRAAASLAGWQRQDARTGEGAGGGAHSQKARQLLTWDVARHRLQSPPRDAGSERSASM